MITVPELLIESIAALLAEIVGLGVEPTSLAEWRAHAAIHPAAQPLPAQDRQTTGLRSADQYIRLGPHRVE
jgi:hypothetical protein